MKQATTCLVVAALVVAALAQSSPGPIIGVLTQSSFGAYGTSYIAASYIKYLESAGARVIPIHYRASQADHTATFGRINGLLIPGGGEDIADPHNDFLIASRIYYDLAVQANLHGDYFPIWGTCQGFQTLSVITNGNASVLSTGFDSENLPLPLALTPAAKTSRMFGGVPPALFEALGTEPITMNSHHDGVTPDAFTASAALSSTYTVLSTNVDRNRHAFISSMEGKTLPFFATQWHPEKNAFEWTPEEDIPHTANAVAICQYLAKFFVDQARRSTHTYPYTQLLDDVIWNFTPLFTLKTGKSNFTQVYAWNF